MKIQEAFNRIWNHFMICEQPISEVGGSPQYRGEGGTKCVVGVLIPDELYRPAMEGLSVDTILARWPALSSHILINNHYNEEVEEIFNFLYDVQRVHDRAVWDGDGPCIYDVGNKSRTAILNVAKRFNLCCPKR